jgi:hypothetical protein
MPKRAVVNALGRMMPENYKGWSANVNLVCYQFSLSVPSLSHFGDSSSRRGGDLYRTALNTGPICLATNDIGRNYHCPVTPESGVRKPAFRRKKNKNQD